MKRSLLATSGMLLVAAAVQGQQPTGPPSLDGNWTLWRRQPNGIANPLHVTIESKRDSVIVKGVNGLELRGISGASSVMLIGKAADKKTDIAINARWVGDSLVGSGKQGPDSVAMLWFARERSRPSSAPTRQTVHPTEFHRVLSTTPRPLAHLWSGDTVHTETVDAGGTDSSGKRRAAGGNPLSGPFYIENSLPGDVLAIHLLRVRTNRSTAVSGATIAFDALDPGYVVGAKDADDSSATWTIDAAAGVARVKTPSAKLKNYTIPLRPMLGSIGVAPGQLGRAEARSSGAPGRWGGNMDYNRLGEGTTVYLQVAQPGAYFFLGDGHATQGDGELTGDALETSMDVEFSVEVIRNKNIGQPRHEDAQFLMASGIGGSLDLAFRRATTSLARWLEQDYKLSRSEVALIMGTGVQYDIGEVVDGDLHVVARFSKALLKGISP